MLDTRYLLVYKFYQLYGIITRNTPWRLTLCRRPARGRVTRWNHGSLGGSLVGCLRSCQDCWTCPLLCFFVFVRLCPCCGVQMYDRRYQFMLLCFAMLSTNRDVRCCMAAANLIFVMESSRGWYPDWTKMVWYLTWYGKISWYRGIRYDV